jgi:hypothetical protein
VTGLPLPVRPLPPTPAAYSRGVWWGCPRRHGGVCGRGSRCLPELSPVRVRDVRRPRPCWPPLPSLAMMVPADGGTRWIAYAAVALLLRAAAAPAAPAAAVTVRVKIGSGATLEVSRAFVSFTIDSAAVCDKSWPFPSNVDAVTVARVRLLSDPGLLIRFGGTSADNEQLQAAGTPMLPRLPKVANGNLGQDGCNITAPQWKSLLDFAESVNASLVYGLDSLLRVDARPEGKVDLRNADGLLSLAASEKWPVGFELGNGVLRACQYRASQRSSPPVLLLPGR